MSLSPFALGEIPATCDREFEFFGTQRSGHHAIMSWVLNGCPEPVFHWDNRVPAHVPWWRRRHRSRLPGIQHHKCCRTAKTVSWAWERVPHDRIVEFGLPSALGWLPAGDRFDQVVIARDPFNQCASWLAYQRKRGSALSAAQLVEYWLQYVGLFDSSKGRFGESRTFINYDRWCTDLDYRATLAQALQITPAKDAHLAEPVQGGGSSFGNITGTLERWQAFAQDPEWMAMLGTPGVLEYSARIWPNLTTQVLGHVSGGAARLAAVHATPQS